MSKFIVYGGHKLRGEVRVQGSKNAAFPAIAAAMLGSGVSEIRNVPDISDVHNFLEIFRFLGGNFKFTGHTLTVDPRRVVSRELPEKLAGKLRGSVLYAGALLGKFGLARFAFPGGDAIGARPIDVHLDGFRRLGAVVKERRGKFDVSAKQLRGNKIVLSFTSVTGTENLILAAVLARGTTVISLAAAEPHVQDLCNFLNKLGAKISGVGTPRITIRGVRRLGRATHTLCADDIVAMTYAVAAAATRGEVTVNKVDLAALTAPLAMLERMGVKFYAKGNMFRIQNSNKPYRATRIITGVYPQLLTDVQPLLGVLATQCEGVSSLHDWIYEGRQGYLLALQKMGAKVELSDAHRAKIFGPCGLHGAQIKTPDIRAGASILIAALVAKGRSVIYNAEIIDRGYEQIDQKLRDLGAKIERIN